MVEIENIFLKKKDKDVKDKNIKIKVLVDHREKNSLVPSLLAKKGIFFEFRHLPLGDYIVNNTLIERKTVRDLKSAIISKRMFNQLQGLKKYRKCLLIIEGVTNEDFYLGIIHENAFRGFLLNLALNEKIPVVYSINEEDTAKYIELLGKKKKAENSIRESKIFRTKKERQQFILEGFPNIGPKKAKKLMESFSSLKEIFNSEEDKLNNVLGNRAKDFIELLK